MCVCTHALFRSYTSIWYSFKFFWDTPYTEQTIFKTFCSRGALQIIHSYSKAEYMQRECPRAPCDGNFQGSEVCPQVTWLHNSSWKALFPGSEDVHRTEGSPAGSILLVSHGWGLCTSAGCGWAPGSRAPRAQPALVAPLLLSWQSISGQWTEVAMPPRKLLASLPRAPQLAGAAPVYPHFVAAGRFPVCVCPMGLFQCQIGAVPRIYLLAFQVEHHYKQLN